MNMKPGDIVTLRHYSGTNLFRSVVIDIHEESVTIKLTKDFVVFNFFEGDPIVLTFETENSIYTASCNLFKVNTKVATISLNVTSIELLTDKRKSERYAVSLYADIRIKGSSKKEIAAVKNMSSEGMMICSKADFSLDQDLEMDLYLEKTLVFLKAEVIWKVNNKHNIEYGLGVYFPSLQVRNMVRRHLQNLKEEQDKYILELKKM